MPRFDPCMRTGGDGVRYAAAYEVNKAKLNQWMTPARQTCKLEFIEDSRRVVDRKDAEARKSNAL